MQLRPPGDSYAARKIDFQRAHRSTRSSARGALSCHIWIKTWGLAGENPPTLSPIAQRTKRELREFCPSRLVSNASTTLESSLQHEGQMQSAANLEFNSGSPQRFFTSALVLLVLAFAIQPCLAGVVPAKAHPCCPTKAPKCHGLPSVAACMMSSTGFEMPEHSGGWNHVLARSAQPIDTFVAALPMHAGVSTPTWVPSSSPVLLLNSVLLI